MTDIAQSIQTGMIEIGIAAGVEHMTRDYGVSLSFRPLSEAIRGSLGEIGDFLEKNTEEKMVDESYSSEYFTFLGSVGSGGGEGLSHANGVNF